MGGCVRDSMGLARNWRHSHELLLRLVHRWCGVAGTQLCAYACGRKASGRASVWKRDRRGGGRWDGVIEKREGWGQRRSTNISRPFCCVVLRCFMLCSLALCCVMLCRVVLCFGQNGTGQRGPPVYQSRWDVRTMHIWKRSPVLPPSLPRLQYDFVQPSHVSPNSGDRVHRPLPS